MHEWDAVDYVNKIRKMLEGELLGTIFVTVTVDDALLIEIKNRDLSYRTCLPNFTERINSDVRYIDIVYQTLWDYKSFIARKFFK